MSGESESSDSDGSKIITSDEEEEFLEEITSTEIEMRGENVQYHTCRICLENYPFDFISPCNCRESPTAKSQISIISCTSPNPSCKLFPIS